MKFQIKFQITNPISNQVSNYKIVTYIRIHACAYVTRDVYYCIQSLSCSNYHMDKLTPPDPLDLDSSNVSDAWRKWRQCFKLFSLASGLSSKGEGIQATTLLHVVGLDALEVYNTFSWEDADDKIKVAKILEKFEAYCVPRKNITWERHVFNTRNQCDGETIDQYVTDLKTKAQTCEFKDLKDSLIRNRIVCGIHCDKMLSRLLREPDLTLQKAIDICRANETTLSQMKQHCPK